SSREDSRAASKTVPPPQRRAASREESTTMTTRRSFSGRQVLTTRSEARALARQSMERTSSPSTYSRSESNSVPMPRIITADRPSRSRSFCVFDGSSRRDTNGGRTRMSAGTSMLFQRSAADRPQLGAHLSTLAGGQDMARTGLHGSGARGPGVPDLEAQHAGRAVDQGEHAVGVITAPDLRAGRALQRQIMDSGHEEE